MNVVDHFLQEPMIYGVRPLSPKPFSLPIDPLRESLCRNLDIARRIVLVAPTGSGKSTRLPLWMASHLRGPVLVVEPRRVACRSLANFLASQRGEKVGEFIGYQVRFEHRSSARTQVLFVTPGIALRLLSSEGKWLFAAVLLDEFHERSWEIDLIATLLLSSRVEASKCPLVLTSATLDGPALAERVGATLMTAEGRSFPVEVRYEQSPDAPTLQGIAGRVAAAVRGALSLDLGDILVFLPGKSQINACQAALSGIEKSRGFICEVVHGGLPAAQLNRALSPKDGVRRVFLSTNVAETSLTLPGVTTVIDSGLVRSRIHRAGRAALAVVPISLASAQQRGGRAGRVAAGRNIRLWASRFKMVALTAPEIERSELDDLVLRAASAGLCGENLTSAPWPSAPPPFSLDRAVARLKASGALGIKGELTEVGRRLSRLPVGAQEARLLLDPPPELAATLADLVALLQRDSDLFLPVWGLDSKVRERVEEARALLLSGISDEPRVQLRGLRAGDPARHHMHRSQLFEVRKVATDLRKHMRCSSRDPQRDRAPLPSADALANFILSRLPEAAFVLRPRAQKEGGGGKSKRGKSPSELPWGNGEVEIFLSPYAPPLAREAGVSALPPPKAGVVLSHRWIGTDARKVRGLGRMLLPCAPSLLAREGVGELKIGEVTLRKCRGSQEICALQTHELAGVTLRSLPSSPLTGAALRLGVAELILKNRLFKGLRDRLLGDLHLWGILCEWPKGDLDLPLPTQRPEPPQEALEFLKIQLAELGLEESEELEMLGFDDLRPSLADIFGLDEWTLGQLVSDFPRVWSHQGAEFVCQVQVRRRRVTLVPDNKAARKGVVPGAKVLPSFRRFSVDYLKASRRVGLRR